MSGLVSVNKSGLHTAVNVISRQDEETEKPKNPSVYNALFFFMVWVVGGLYPPVSLAPLGLLWPSP